MSMWSRLDRHLRRIGALRGRGPEARAFVDAGGAIADLRPAGWPMPGTWKSFLIRRSARGMYEVATPVTYTGSARGAPRTGRENPACSLRIAPRQQMLKVRSASRGAGRSALLLCVFDAADRDAAVTAWQFAI